MRQMTEVEKAYMAGLFDGEGCVFISKVEPHGAHVSPIYTLRIIIGMTNEAAVNRIRDFCGVGIVHRNNKQASSNHAVEWQWIASQREAAAVLVQLRPYLFLKADQADTALEFISIGTNQLTGRRGTVSPHVIKQRDELRNLLMAQKKDGKIYSNGIIMQPAQIEEENPQYNLL